MVRSPLPAAEVLPGGGVLSGRQISSVGLSSVASRFREGGQHGGDETVRVSGYSYPPVFPGDRRGRWQVLKLYRPSPAKRAKCDLYTCSILLQSRAGMSVARNPA